MNQIDPETEYRLTDQQRLDSDNRIAALEERIRAAQAPEPMTDAEWLRYGGHVSG